MYMYGWLSAKEAKKKIKDAYKVRLYGMFELILVPDSRQLGKNHRYDIEIEMNIEVGGKTHTEYYPTNVKLTKREWFRLSKAKRGKLAKLKNELEDDTLCLFFMFKYIKPLKK